MLAPETRTLLLDALRPPLGAQLDHAVATTFTLDLASALTVPLALAGFNLSGTPDMVAVMEALRSSADRLDVFAQAGMVKASAWPGDLAALLERSVHTVHRPRPGHLFHPKLWVLRFVDQDDTYSYRCVITSRNLTADRSWDVILRLDSDPDSTKINTGNDGLVRLISALPTMPGASMSDERRDRVLLLAEELRRVWWQPPDDVNEIRFLAFGVPGGLRARDYGTTFKGYRHLLISPFLTADGIDLLLGDSTGSEVTIVSRAEQLDAVKPDDLADCELFVLNSLAGLGDGEVDQAVETDSLLSDLHAKVYVIEAAKRAYVYIGSANATHAAFHGNVEILCELSGGPKNLGVATMLADTAPFRGLLDPYSTPAEQRVDARTEAAHRLESYLVDLAECDVLLSIGEAAAEGFEGRLRSSKALPAVPAGFGLTLQIAPFNRQGERSSIEPGSMIDVKLGARPAADITAFFMVHASATIDGHAIERSTVLRAMLVGDPPQRFDDILIRQLDTPEKFLRFLMLLLALGGDAGVGIDASGGAGAWSARPTEGLFELLVRALAVQPEAIDRLVSIVEHLEQTGKGGDVLPAGWTEVWSSIRAARTLVGRRTK